MLQIEYRNQPDARRRFRVWLLAVLATPFPLLFGSLMSHGQLDSPFGVTLIATAILLTAFNVTVVPWATVMDQRHDIGPDGIAVQARIGPGRARWSLFRSVRVIPGGEAAPTRITFSLAGLRARCWIAIDMSKHPEAAERLSSAIARYAPHIRPTGRRDLFRWDPAGPVDGQFAFSDPFHESLWFVWLSTAAAAAVAMSLPALLIPELFPDKGYRLAVVVAYFGMVSGYVAVTNR